MDQAWPESTRDNLRFLCSEVDSQYGWLQAFVSAPTAAMARKLLERQGYAEAMYNDDQEAFKEFTASDGFARCTLLDEGSTP